MHLLASQTLFFSFELAEFKGIYRLFQRWLSLLDSHALLIVDDDVGQS